MSDDQYLQMFFDESEEYIQMLNENILDFTKRKEETDVIELIDRKPDRLAFWMNVDIFFSLNIFFFRI